MAQLVNPGLPLGEVPSSILRCYLKYFIDFLSFPCSFKELKITVKWSTEVEKP